MMNDPCYSFGSNLDVAYEIFFPHCTLLYVKEAINIFEEPYRIIFENRHCQEEKNTIHSDFTNSLLMGAGSSMSMVEHKDLEGVVPQRGGSSSSRFAGIDLSSSRCRWI